MANRRQTAEENSAAWNRFFHETKVEMKKVIWPTKQQLGRYTVTVIASVLLVSCLLVAVDFVFMGLSKLLVSAVG
jgi:preprotein translocase, secE subunit